MASTDASASASRSVATTHTTTTTKTHSAALRASRPSQHPTRSSASSHPSSSHVEVGNGARSSERKSTTNDEASISDVVVRGASGSEGEAKHRNASSHGGSSSSSDQSSDAATTATTSFSSNSQLKKQQQQQQSGSRQGTASHPSSAGAGSAVTASNPQPYSAPGSRISSQPPSLSSQNRQRSAQQQQQQQQQRPVATPAKSPTPAHSAADVARVRAALAEAGYPNPSWHDIERVFAQMEQTAAARAETNEEATPTANAAVTATSGSPLLREAREQACVDDLGYTYPASASLHPRHAAAAAAPRAILSHDQSGLLHYLEPSRRLERYIQLRERELENMCLHPIRDNAAASLLGTSQRSVNREPQPRALNASLSDRQPRRIPLHSSRSKNRKTAAGRSPRLPSPPHRPHTAVATMAAQRRRAANIVFDITGDQRFRFFPTTRAPQGSGAILTTPRTTAASTYVGLSSPPHAAGAATAVAGASADSESFAEQSAPQRNMEGRHRSSMSVPAAPLTPCPNFYNPTRATHAAVDGGGRGLHSRTFDAFPSSSSASPTSHRKSGPSVLSGNTVSYLDPQGCTLRHKADPVKRGQQMRVLWARDNFLSQRHRPQEAWRTRQITMAYQEATGE